MIPMATNRTFRKKYLFWAGSICALLILFALLHCFLPHRLFPQKESRYTPEIDCIYLGDREITSECNTAALLDILQNVTYLKRVFPTGYTTVKQYDDLIQITIRYVPTTFNDNWVWWNLYLTPRWQYCTHGSFQWMYPICDGEELYNSIISLCQ